MHLGRFKNRFDDLKQWSLQLLFQLHYLNHQNDFGIYLDTYIYVRMYHLFSYSLYLYVKKSHSLEIKRWTNKKRMKKILIKMFRAITGSRLVLSSHWILFLLSWKWHLNLFLFTVRSAPNMNTRYVHQLNCHAGN